MFSMRFDMRARDGAATLPALYETALEMCGWAEGRGCVAIQVSEHHASPDGYLPAPLVLTAALVARTQRLPIQVAALLLPLHDPLALAEQMVVLDHLSGGRVSYVCALGYRPEEYAMFGRDMKQRGRRMEECLRVLQQAFNSSSGEPFEYQGRRVQVTPRPLTPGGPMLLMGGNSLAAVRRAARFGLGMLTMGGDPSLEASYRESCAEFGTTPGLFINPDAGVPASCFVAEDKDAAWRELGPYLLHDAQMYASWLGDTGAITRSAARDIRTLRAEQGNYRIFSVEEAIAFGRRHGLLMLQPLCGGLPPELAWRSLELVAERVMPALGSAS